MPKEEDLREPLLANDDEEEINGPLLDWPFGNILSPDEESPLDDIMDHFNVDSTLINIDTTLDGGDLGFSIEHIKFPERIYKKQRRMTINRKQISQQRLNEDEGKFKLKLNFSQPNALQQIYQATAKVKRQNVVPSNMNLFTDAAPIPGVEMFQDEPNSTAVILTASLDNVYKIGDKEVYKLAKTGVNEHNMFVVIIEVIFQNGTTTTNTTNPFLVVGRTEQHKEKFALPGILNPNYIPKTGKKRRIDLDHRSPSSVESRGSLSSSPLSNYFSDSPDSSVCSNRYDAQYARVQRQVFDYIKAKVGEFDELRGNLIKTGNGDIAYHFAIKPNSHADFRAGEIIGFFSDKLGKTVIEMLTAENAAKAFMKGVVTDCQYIEANKPEDESIKTATICMLGLVHVNTLGSVEAGEHLFSSRRCPGMAVSEYHPSHIADDTDAYIGQALEKKKCKRESERNPVKALVSLVGGATHGVMKKEWKEMEKSIEVNMKVGGRNSRRCVCIASIVTTLILALLLVAFWQLFVPGSEYKRLMCRRGSIAGSSRYARYWKWAEGLGREGIEFDCIALWDKVKDRFYQHKHRANRDHYRYQCPDERYHYYLNEDTCSGVKNDPLMFAIDNNCTHVFTFNEDTGIWRIEKLVCWHPKCNLVCSFVAHRNRTNCGYSYNSSVCSKVESKFDRFFTLTKV